MYSKNKVEMMLHTHTHTEILMQFSLGSNPALSFCVALENDFHLSLPSFPPAYGGDSNSSNFLRLMGILAS